MPQAPRQQPAIQPIISKYRQEYKKLRPVFCPAIGETVHFNSQGFNHLIFKNGHRRANKVIHSRMILIPLIAPALKNSKCSATLRKKTETIGGKNAEVTYLAVEATVGKSSPAKVRVVVRKIGDRGKYCFHSIMRRR